MNTQVTEFAIEDDLLGAMKEAGSLLAEMQKDPHLKEIEKDDGSATTPADLESQKVLVKYFHNRYPELHILAEEKKLANLHKQFKGVKLLGVGDAHEELPADYISIDPNDGTAFFANQSPEFSVSAAVVHDGRPVAGVIYQPLTNHIFATPCQYYQPGPIGTYNKSLDRALIGLDNQKYVKKKFRGRVITPLIGACRFPENLPSVASGIHVLLGITGAWITNNARNWDVAATAVLIESAGGVTYQLVRQSGRWHLDAVPWNAVKMPPLLFAANEKIAQEVLTVLNAEAKKQEKKNNKKKLRKKK